MISEKYFINNYPDLWNSFLPIARIFQRNINKQLENSKGIRKNIIDISGKRRSYISYVSFNVLKEYIEKNTNKLNEDEMKKIENICKEKFKVYLFEDKNINDKLLAYEWDVINALANNMHDFFIEEHDVNSIIINPRFSGCGIIDNCYGDIYMGNCLYEVKSVNRNFRIVDFKQLLIYSCLNHVSKQYDIKEVCLYNPLNCKYFKLDLNEFCLSVSGKTYDQLFNEIINFITNDEVSS